MLTALRKFGGRTVCFKFRGRVYRGLILPLHYVTSPYDYIKYCVIHAFSLGMLEQQKYLPRRVKDFIGLTEEKCFRDGNSNRGNDLDYS